MFIFRAPGSSPGKGCKMRDKLRNLFSGRQGMDELSKFQFWFGLAGFLIGCFLPGFLGRLFIWLGIFSLISAFVRAFSRQLDRREMENRAYLAYLDRWKNKYAAWKDRFSQRKSYRFFKCPGCGTYIRVPKGKGKIHIKCRCGYTLYRKT